MLRELSVASPTVPVPSRDWLTAAARVGPGWATWYLPRVLLGVAAVVLAVNVLTPGGYFQADHMGHDYTLYMNAARSWLAGTGFYLPYQLAGPYPVTEWEVLYPPTILPLLVPFTVLPAVIWWAIPLGILGWQLSRVRSLWAWALIFACLATPRSLMILTTGNPSLWIAASVSLGLGGLVLCKPSLLPLALLGWRTNRWAVSLIGVLALAVVFLPMSLDYLTVLRSATGVSILYSLGDVPFMVIAVVAWLAPQQRPQHPRQLSVWAVRGRSAAPIRTVSSAS